MTNVRVQDYASWIGRRVVDPSGGKVGKVSEIFIDDQSGQPEWLAISTGMFGKHSSFVPVQGAAADGDSLVIGWDKDKVRDAPRVDDDGDGHLTPLEEKTLYTYYGRDFSPPDADRFSDRTDEAAMSRSEEHRDAGIGGHESGGIRLRKYVATGEVFQSVPGSAEQVRVERQPVDVMGSSVPGPEISKDEQPVASNDHGRVVDEEILVVERLP
jgi:sporulation protein YlmC with PRC-barrel domain